MISAWLGGVGPGILAIALSSLAFDYYFLEPLHSFTVNSEEVPRLFVFVVAALFVGSLSAAQRNAMESLRRARDDLKGTVQDLQNMNETLQAESRERKQGEEKLRQNEAYLRESQRLGHIGSWAFNVFSGDLFASPEFLRIFGRDPDQEKPTVEMFRGNVHPEDRAYVDETINRAMREKTDFGIDHRIILPGGSVRHVYSMAHRVFDGSGTLIEYIGTVMDVTERKRAEEALRRAQADLAHVNRVTAMGELMASLAHEVNQPIAAAVTNANTCLRWLTRENPDLEEAREAAMRIVKDGTRAADIISRVRLLFKKGAPEREFVDVNAVIREMIVLLRGEAAQYSISFRTDLASDLPHVTGDRVQLQQVFMNLMLNGIDAMKSVDGAREMIIKSRRTENEHILLSVSDTGVGLPVQHADQIFNAFFTTKGQGMGMGLRISQSIVESHKGRLWAGDNSPRGASFYVSLPTKVEEHELP